MICKIIYAELSTYWEISRVNYPEKNLTLIWLSLKSMFLRNLTHWQITTYSRLENKDLTIILYTHFRPNIIYLNCCLPFIYALLIRVSNQVWSMIVSRFVLMIDKYGSSKLILFIMTKRNNVFVWFCVYFNFTFYNWLYIFKALAALIWKSNAI